MNVVSGSKPKSSSGAREGRVTFRIRFAASRNWPVRFKSLCEMINMISNGKLLIRPSLNIILNNREAQFQPVMHMRRHLLGTGLVGDASVT